MRNKIIAVNAIIVLITGLLGFAIVRQTLVTAASNPAALTERAKRDAQSAASKLQLDGLRAERWLAGKAQEPAASDALTRATSGARADAAVALSDRVLSAAKQTFSGNPPSLVMVVDAQGKSVGQNGSALSAGQDLGAQHPLIKETIAKGQSGSDVWISQSGQYMVAYVQVRDDSGKPVGALVMGVPLGDELGVGENNTGRGVMLAVANGADISLAASSISATDDLKAAADKTLKAELKTALSSGHVETAQAGDVFLAAAPLENFGDGKHAAVVVASPTTLLADAKNIPIYVLMSSLLGLILVIIGGWFLGDYISKPIGVLEEGLLAILNGQTDKRFELEHADLGGLAFRIDQLLNQLMGIEEDTTDDQGRVSKAPSAANFSDAMSVDRSGGAGGGGGGAGGGEAIDAQALKQEPTDAYYARIFAEYIAAKRSLGEATDHITQDTFRTRIQGMEQDAHQKHGRPVRYKVQTVDGQVNFLAVPLP
jgi:hypothetical protein